MADMVKRRALAVGLDGAFAGHSLRTGFATEGYAKETPELAIMRHGRWRSASVMRGYVEKGSIWNDNAAARLGLWHPCSPPAGMLASFAPGQQQWWPRQASQPSLTATPAMTTPRSGLPRTSRTGC